MKRPAMKRPAMKFCGITSVEDAFAAADCGADADRLRLRAGEPARDRARGGARHRPAAAAVPAPRRRVRRYAAGRRADDCLSASGWTSVQLHGRETPADAAAAWPRVIKALARQGDLLAQAAAWDEDVTLLVDAATGEAPGGTGQLADWPAAAALARTRRLVLAGGLTADNVGEAIAIVRPYAVDVSSGIETRPGEKSAARMRAFARAVEAAWRRDDDDAG